jgi:hypothetical protein
MIRACALLLLLSLAACSARTSESAASPAPVGQASESAAAAPEAAAPAAPAPAPAVDAATSAPSQVENGVDYGCAVAQDCAVKNIGNCCGYFPACVNKDSPTFPEQVKADCAAQGLSSICGFQEIASCDCVEGRCAAIGGPAGVELR